MNLSLCFKVTFIALLLTAIGGAPNASAELSAAERNLPPRLDDVPVSELEARVAKHDLSAQAELGARYGRGAGVPQNVDRAIQLLRDAADKGDASAQFYLGTAYANGLGVPASIVQASLLYEKAAEQHYAAAAYQLAILIAYGRAGIEASWTAAIPYLWDAADQGYRDAELVLGYAFSKGYGVERSPRAAAYWFRRTLSRLSHTRARLGLRELIEAGEIEWQEGDPGQVTAETTKDGITLFSVQP